MAIPPYIRSHEGGARLDVFVQPKAAREGFVGVHGAALKLKVRAPALEGKANRAAQELLAKALDVPVSGVSLVAGEKSRNKRFVVSGLSPSEVAARLKGGEERRS